MSGDQFPTHEQQTVEPRDRASGGAGGANGEVDPLERLHKMSRTAGVGTGEYVAVNSVAVAALLLALFGWLALIVPTLLVIPLAAVVCAAVALVQISRSGGTQTGRWLAILGLVVALLFVAGQGARQAIGGVKTRADRQAVASAMEQFGQKLHAEDFAGAYAMTGKKFHDRVSEDQFTNAFKARFRHPSHGPIREIHSNGLIEFEKDDAGVNRTAASTAIVTLTSTEDRQPMLFEKVGNEWIIDDLPGWFAAAPQRPRSAPR
jgi:hypothetical protein